MPFTLPCPRFLDQDLPGSTGDRSLDRPRPRPSSVVRRRAAGAPARGARVLGPVVATVLAAGLGATAVTPAQASTLPRSSTHVASRPAAARSVTGTAAVMAWARRLSGIWYVYGGDTPAGFDCSGYVQYIYRKVGIHLPRTAEEQRRAVRWVSSPRVGDLVFFGLPAYHVGIYAGDGMMYDSPRTGERSGLQWIWSADVTYGRP